MDITLSCQHVFTEDDDGKFCVICHHSVQYVERSVFVPARPSAVVRVAQ